ncbi:MAG TPA: hypothetical protein VFR81_02850, partial [Longimicrobium sp.]|nr:hypothetical protein [Longimicrobium sp.]
MTVRNLLRTLVAALCLLAAAIIFAPSRAEAQETCISCPPGGGPPQTPPGVSISPGSGTITGEEAGKNETVVIDVCSPVPMGTGSILIRLDGVDVTARFSTGPSGEPYTDPGCATHYRSTGTVLLSPGTHAVTAQATNIHGTGSDQANLTYRVTTWGILVGPDDLEAGVAPGAAASQVFTVSNTGNVTATYNIAALCGLPVASTCSANTSQVTLGAGASAPVTLSYTGGTAGANGPVRLRATRAGATDSYDEGSVQLNVANPSGTQVAPVLTVSEASPGATPTPALCLTMPAG